MGLLQVARKGSHHNPRPRTFFGAFVYLFSCFGLMFYNIHTRVLKEYGLYVLDSEIPTEHSLLNHRKIAKKDSCFFF